MVVEKRIWCSPPDEGKSPEKNDVADELHCACVQYTRTPIARLDLQGENRVIHV
jgi:hypothetical protein